jgi:para-nitrobenzyl esterase
MKISKFAQLAMFTMSLTGLIFLTACSDSDDDFNLKSGHFYDSAVKNLKYKTPSDEGTTDEEGTFWYLEGEKITFSVGNLVIGEATAKESMSPVDLVADATYDNYSSSIKVKNIAYFLQRLDKNHKPEDGIEIDAKVHEELEEDNKSWHMDMIDEAIKELSDAEAITLNEFVDKDSALKHLTSEIIKKKQDET